MSGCRDRGKKKKKTIQKEAESHGTESWGVGVEQDRRESGGASETQIKV